MPAATLSSTSGLQLWRPWLPLSNMVLERTTAKAIRTLTHPARALYLRLHFFDRSAAIRFSKALASFPAIPSIQ